MLRLILLAIALGICASAHADDEFSAARHHPGLTAKWRVIQARMSEDGAQLAACRADPQSCSPEVRLLSAILEASREREGRARIGHINRAVNLAIRPISDSKRYGVVDQWSAPIETLQAGGGDCEDYAILKFLILREAGLPESHLKLLIVRQPGSSTVHAVLAARIDDDWLLLDNRGFALVALADSRYRVLAQLMADSTANGVLANAAGPDLPPLL